MADTQTACGANGASWMKGAVRGVYCQTEIKIIRFIVERKVIRKILPHLKLWPGNEIRGAPQWSGKVRCQQASRIYTLNLPWLSELINIHAKSPAQLLNGNPG